MSCDANHKCPRMYLLFAALFVSFPHLKAPRSLPICASLLYLYILQATSPMALCQAVIGFRSPPFTSVESLRRPLGGTTTIANSRMTPLCVYIAHLAAVSQSRSSTLA